jgi:hypothetical protein
MIVFWGSSGVLGLARWSVVSEISGYGCGGSLVGGCGMRSVGLGDVKICMSVHMSSRILWMSGLPLLGSSMSTN